MTEYHVTFIVKNLMSSAESSDESFVDFCFDLVVRNHCDSADQNSHNAVEFYSFFFKF